MIQVEKYQKFKSVRNFRSMIRATTCKKILKRGPSKITLMGRARGGFRNGNTPISPHKGVQSMFCIIFIYFDPPEFDFVIIFLL